MVVTINNLVKRYGDLIAIDHLNLEVHEGEILGLLGPNGSGKSTTINCILSLLKYDKGTIEIFGKPMKPNAYDVKQDIGIVMQNVAVFGELTVHDNIEYFCGLYVKDKTLRKQYVQEAIDFVGLNDFVKFYPKKLSGGLLRRLNIACGIAHKPKLVILDEPTVAVDPQSRNNILEGIQKLNENGTTVIYTSHYMEEVENLCTRIVIIDKGKEVASGTKDELKAMIKTGEKITATIYNLSEEMLQKLLAIPSVLSAEYKNNTLNVRLSRGPDSIMTILDFLNTNKIVFEKIYSEQPSLNDVFLEITGKELRDNGGN